MYRHVESESDAAEAESRLKDLAAAEDNEHGIDTTVAVGGDLVESIVEAAGSNALVCMGTAASVRFHSGHFGSVAEAVTRQLGRPLALVGPEMEPEPGSSTKKVVVAIDGSPLSEMGIDVGAELASILGVPLWLVTVITPKQMSASREVGVDTAAMESNYVHNRSQAVAADYDIEVDYEVLHRDDAAEAIVEFVGDDGTAVLTTHGRSGLSRLVAGSVATGVVAKSKRAVFVYRPPEDDGES